MEVEVKVAVAVELDVEVEVAGAPRGAPGGVCLRAARPRAGLFSGRARRVSGRARTCPRRLTAARRLSARRYAACAEVAPALRAFALLNRGNAYKALEMPAEAIA